MVAILCAEMHYENQHNKKLMHSLLVHIYHIEGTLMALMATPWYRLFKITNLKNLKSISF